jgi:hypothetical protein
MSKRTKSLIAKYQELEDVIKAERPEAEDYIKILRRQNHLMRSAIKRVRKGVPLTVECREFIEKNLE